MPYLFAGLGKVHLIPNYFCGFRVARVESACNFNGCT